MILTVVYSRWLQKALRHITEEREAGNIWLSDFEGCAWGWGGCLIPVHL